VRRWLVAWLPVVLWTGVIFGLSSIPGTQLPPVDLPQADKLAHLLVYSVLGALVLRGVRRNGFKRGGSQIGVGAGAGAGVGAGVGVGWRWGDFAVAIMLTTLYGISDEIHQYWTPNRTPDWHDVVADALGAGLGALAFVATRWMKIRVCLMMERSKH
jgi:VanZ family protein